MDRQHFPKKKPEKKKFDELKSPPIVNMLRVGIFEVFLLVFEKDRKKYL